MESKMEVRIWIHRKGRRKKGKVRWRRQKGRIYFPFTFFIFSSLWFLLSLSLSLSAYGANVEKRPVSDCYFSTNHWNPYPAIPAYRYQKIDETTPNNDTDYVRETSDGYLYDFNPQDFMEGGAIDSVKLIWVYKKTVDDEAEVFIGRGYVEESFFNQCGTWPTKLPNLSYGSYSITWTQDPCTGQNWTNTYLNNDNYGFGIKTGALLGGNEVRATQAYIVVYYTPSAQPGPKGIIEIDPGIVEGGIIR